jgi:GNAT superfamily N-acetyltransferase
MTELRPLAAHDFEKWLPLWQRYLVFYKTSVPDDVSRVTFARLTNGAEPMGGFIVADDKSNAAGFVHWITHRSCWTVNDYCYLQDLYVAEGQRGTGLGRRLIEAVYAEAKSRQCSRVYWLTQDSNATAMQLYDRIGERSGFVQYRKLLE